MRRTAEVLKMIWRRKDGDSFADFYLYFLYRSGNTGLHAGNGLAGCLWRVSCSCFICQFRLGSHFGRNGYLKSFQHENNRETGNGKGDGHFNGAYGSRTAGIFLFAEFPVVLHLRNTAGYRSRFHRYCPEQLCGGALQCNADELPALLLRDRSDSQSVSYVHCPFRTDELAGRLPHGVLYSDGNRGSGGGLSGRFRRKKR